MEHRDKNNAAPCPESMVKRRKIRKDTTSCWECKHRKKRCDFEPGSTACAFCLRHRLECVSQEFSRTTSDYENVGKRIDQIETLVNQLIQQRKRKSTATSESSTGSEIPQWLQYPTLRSVNHERLSRGRSLTGYLFSILPDPAIAAVILRSSKLFRAPLQIAQSQQSSSAEMPPGTPEILPTAHPVSFARRLIQLALCLQHSDTKSSEELKLQLKQPANDAAQRYFAAASNLVMSQDFLIASLDGLQTLMLQGRYHITIGDLRTAWLIHRRAANIAHAMGFPRLAETAGGRADSVWFELIYSDRFLSLMLGLPFAISDNSPALPGHVNITPVQRLERLHVLLAGRIIARNLSMQCPKKISQQRDSNYEEYQETTHIDQQLKKAIRLMPAAWWPVPSLNKTASDSEVAEKTAKLLVQMHQYYLLVFLHQPYVIDRLGEDHPDHMYSKLAAVSASREVITRYLVLRNYHRAPSFRAMDEKGFTASITLLFAHFDGHRLGNANVLEHQRPHDLGIIEKVTNLIEEISASDRQPSDISRAQILRRFLDVEADAADGSSYSTWKNNETGGSMIDGDDLQLSIPFFGTLHITRQQLQNSSGINMSDLNLVRMSEILPEVLVPGEKFLTPLDTLDHPTSAIQELPSQEVDTSWLHSWMQSDSN